MVTFRDGPAKGASLLLKRCVHYLRVVRGAEGKWDALDQPDDEPKATEAIFAYRLIRRDGNAFVDGRDPKTGKRWGTSTFVGTYAVIEPQPEDEDMRTKARWVAWVEAHHATERDADEKNGIP